MRHVYTWRLWERDGGVDTKTDSNNVACAMTTDAAGAFEDFCIILGGVAIYV